MKLILSILIIYCLASCNKTNSGPVFEDDSVNSMEVSEKLKKWSITQPQPFVICAKGDTTGGKLYDIGDLITNLIFYPTETRWELIDSLVIVEWYANSLFYKIGDEGLNSIFDSFSISSTEELMVDLLIEHGLKLRMMNYDSLTYNLNIKLLEWASYQSPDQVIWSGFHSFIREGPNAGGYSHVWFTHHGVQNLQYFTRNISQIDLQNIIASVDTSLSYSELHNILLPIAEIQIHDTEFGFE